jgi:hypothetical protein
MSIEQRQAEACFDAAVDKHVGANVVLKAIRFTNSNAGAQKVSDTPRHECQTPQQGPSFGHAM